MARMLGVRWEEYQKTTKWRPTHTFLLAEVRGRAAAGFLESALIVLVLDLEVDANHNQHFQNSDMGGTGPRLEDFLDDQYFVYLATKAVPE